MLFADPEIIVFNDFIPTMWLLSHADIEHYFYNNGYP